LPADPILSRRRSLHSQDPAFCNRAADLAHGADRHDALFPSAKWWPSIATCCTKKCAAQVRSVVRPISLSIEPSAGAGGSTIPARRRCISFGEGCGTKIASGCSFRSISRHWFPKNINQLIWGRCVRQLICCFAIRTLPRERVLFAEHRKPIGAACSIIFSQAAKWLLPNKVRVSLLCRRRLCLPTRATPRR